MRLNLKKCPGLAWGVGVFIFGVVGGVSAGPVRVEDKSVVVANPKDPVPPAGQRKRLVFKEELTIGAAEGDENYLFEKNIQVAADEKGAIYVVNWDRKRIQKYDAKGKYLFTMGRKGQGPGEFQNIWSPRFDGQGRIYATDISAARVIFFDKENGRFQVEIKTGQQAGAVFLLPNGMYFSSTTMDKQTQNMMSYVTVYGIFGKDFKLQTELHRDFIEFKPAAPRGPRAQFLAGIMSETAFKPLLNPCVTDDGKIVIAYPASYEVKIYDDRGKASLIIRKDDKPKPVTDAHRKYYFETSVMEFLAGNQSYMAVKEDVRKAMTYPKFLPAYRFCYPMDNGWLFVVEDSLLESSRIDLFDQKGVYIGRFDTDLPVSLLTFANGKAYAVADVEGFKYVKRYGYTIQNY
jgi:hypothetical protein